MKRCPRCNRVDDAVVFCRDKYSTYPTVSPDGKLVAYFYRDENSPVRIAVSPFDGGAPKQLTDFKADRLFWFDFWRDGHQVALSRGRQTSDVILIKDFR